jgi:hypothetical protein
MNDDLELWHVALRDGSVRAMNVDQLDQAFHAGWIDAKTRVLQAGSLEWSTLGEVAGLEDDETPSPTSAVPNSVAPLSLDDEDIPPELRPKKRGRLFGVAVAIALVAGLGFAATRARPGIFAPVTAQIAKLRAAATKAEPARAATVVAAPAPAPAPAPEPAKAEPAPAPAPPPKVDTPAPVPVSALATAPASSATVPTLSAHELPNAHKGKHRKSGRH